MKSFRDEKNDGKEGKDDDYDEDSNRQVREDAGKTEGRTVPDH